MLCGKKQHNILSLKIDGFVVTMCFFVVVIVFCRISTLAFLGMGKYLQTVNKSQWAQLLTVTALSHQPSQGTSLRN